MTTNPGVRWSSEVAKMKQEKLEMFSEKPEAQTVSTQTDSAMNFSDSAQYNSTASYGSETEEDIDIKPGISDFFVKVETNFPMVFKTEVVETNANRDMNQISNIVIQRIESPLLVPKLEPVSDTEASLVNNSSQTEMDMIDDSVLEDKSNLNIERSQIELAEVTTLWDSDLFALEEQLVRKRKRAKKKHLTVSQMCDIIQNDNGFFSNKKKWMSEKVLRQLPNKDKIFLSNLFKKFMKRNKLKKQT